MMAARWKTLAMALALIALHGDVTSRSGNGVMAEADCLGDGETCANLETCPLVCCTGVSIRSNSHVRHCPLLSAVFGSAAGPSATAAALPLSDDNSHWEAIGSATASSADDNTQSTNGADPAATATDAPSSQGNSNSSAAATPTTKPASKSNDSVDAFQSTESIGNSRGGGGSKETLAIAGGAVVGCVVLVAAVMYKRKSTTKKDLDAPSSSYRGSDNAGLTPDNRSLVGMLDGGARATTESMKQLPVLSMGGRDDSSIVARISSPFGQGLARISSPANRGATNEDYAFEVETSSRAGSSVQVAFVDVNHDADIIPEKNGVVAL